MACLPMFVDLTGKRTLVIGTGRVAEHKKALLEEYGAVVGRKESLAAGEIGKILDTEEPFLVVVSLRDPALEEEVSLACRARRIPVNVVDVPSLCTFIFPCLSRDGDLVLAVSSGGNSPLVAQMARDAAKKALPKGLGAVNSLMGAV